MCNNLVKSPGWPRPRPASVQPGSTGRGKLIIPNGRIVRPYGKTVTVAPHPFGLTLSPDGRVAVTANSGFRPFSISIVRNLEGAPRSPYWKKMAIFVTEDDAQDGRDHVDAHRSLLMVLSPYARRNYVGHQHYSFGSIFKTFVPLEPEEYFREPECKARAPFVADPIDIPLVTVEKLEVVQVVTLTRGAERRPGARYPNPMIGERHAIETLRLFLHVAADAVRSRCDPLVLVRETGLGVATQARFAVLDMIGVGGSGVPMRRVAVGACQRAIARRRAEACAHHQTRPRVTGELLRAPEHFERLEVYRLTVALRAKTYLSVSGKNPGVEDLGCSRRAVYGSVDMRASGAVASLALNPEDGLRRVEHVVLPCDRGRVASEAIP